MTDPTIDHAKVRQALREAAQSPDGWWTDPACLVPILEDEDPDEYDLLDDADKAQLAMIMRL
jgi:hypothetical protein